MPSVAQPSLMSLLLEMRFSGQTLATGTGFVCVSPKGQAVLFTNRHNVTGRDNYTDEILDKKNGGLPNELVVKHNREGAVGSWIEKVVHLYDTEGSPQWIEHPRLGRDADLVGIVLEDLSEVGLYPYDLSPDDWRIMLGPASVVSVVGFPFGLSQGGGLAIWATGFVASELDLDEPTFLIDCRSRKGQSGSAVIAYRSPGLVALADGVSKAFSQPVWNLLGIYSGRINAESDLGRVWKASLLRELLQAADGDRSASYLPSSSTEAAVSKMGSSSVSIGSA